MAERPSVLELESALADLGRHVAYPATPDLATRVRQELAARPTRSPLRWAAWLPNQRRLALALVALIALAAAVLAISPDARTALAERLGLRGVLIRDVPARPTSPAASPSPGARLLLGVPLRLDQARARVTFQIPLPTPLGAPDEVYLLDTPPGGQIALVYYPRPDLPPANTTGIGLLLTAFQGTVPTGIFGKGIPPGTRVEEVQVNGGPAYWIEGDPHTFFFLDSRGQVRTETTRLAGNVLLWEQGTLTLRLESALSRDQALAIATSTQ